MLSGSDKVTLLKKAGILSLLLLSGCGNNPPSVSSTSRLSSTFQIQAHRGGAALNPENSLAAFAFATSVVGADSVELDIHQTVDGVLVVHHDPKINPSLCLAPDGKRISRPAPISKMTFAEVRRFDCGPLTGLPGGTPLPTLGEVFETVKALKTPSGGPGHYTVHIKWEPETIEAEDYLRLILDSIERHKVHERVHLMSDSPEILEAARKLDSSIDLYFLSAMKSPADIELVKKLEISTVVPQAKKVSVSVIEAAHKRGVRVIPFGEDLPFGWERLMDMGVDGIITDDPLNLHLLLQGHLNPNLHGLEMNANGTN